MGKAFTTEAHLATVVWREFSWRESGHQVLLDLLEWIHLAQRIQISVVEIVKVEN